MAARKKRPSPLQARHAANIERRRRTTASRSRNESQTPPKVEAPPIPMMDAKLRWFALIIVALAGIASYAPSIYLLAIEWDRLEDYSHGYLVIPFALILAWLRRKSFPALSQQIQWLGLLPIMLSVGLRWVGAAYFIQFVDGISIMFWVAGAVWMVAGWRVLLWSLPAVAFLFFMVPLPYSVNLMVSGPLQEVATSISTWLLQLFGQPALAENRMITLNEHNLEVAQACSGLRIFVGILALAHFIVFMSKRPLIENLVILASVLPIALAANAIRIVSTGMLMQYASTETAKTFSHDVAGWLMIPLACVMFWMFIWYLTHLFPRVKRMGLDEMQDRTRVATQS